MYLIFDVETSGFPNPRIPTTSKGQARIIQIAAVLFNENFVEIARVYELIKIPEHVQIAEGAFAAHGITKEMCAEKGKEITEVLEGFNFLLSQASYLIAHNYIFDSTMLNIEMDNIQLTHPELFNNLVLHLCALKDKHCTMELMTSICKLEHKRKGAFGTKYKWPKLAEAYQHALGKELQGAHDSLNDVLATAEVYSYLLGNKLIESLR